MVARQKIAEAEVYNKQAVDALAGSVELATDRYLNGKSSYFEVLEAQQQLYPSQRAQVQTQVNALVSVVQLYKALGGGWQPQAEASEPAVRH
jgi:outer membrane protein, multidrug efflux system